MTRPEGPPRLEISDPVLSGRSEQSQGPSRLQRIGIHAAGVVLVAVGVLGMVQAGMVNEQRSAEVEAAAAAYSDLDDELRSAQEEVRSVPSLPQARRWVTSATSTAQSVADKQNFLMDATSPWDSGVLEPTERLPSQAGRDPDPQALQEHHENWVSDRVEQTERELVMLFASDQRDAQGFNAASAWHEALSGLPADSSGYTWTASSSPSVGRSIRVPITWVLTEDAAGEPLAVMSGYYEPHDKVFQDLSLTVLDAEEG